MRQLPRAASPIRVSSRLLRQTENFNKNCRSVRRARRRHGGSPYGAGTLAGPDGSRQPSALEKDIAEAHGEHFGAIAAKLAK